MIGIGELAGIGTGLFWSISCLIHTEASKTLGATSMLVVRIPLAVTCLAALVLFSGEVHNYPLSSIVLMVLSGLFGIATCDWCFYYAIQSIGVRAALVCQSLYASIAAVLGVLFLNETLGWQGFIGILVASVGVVAVIAAEQDTQGNIQTTPHKRRVGIVLAFGSALSLAIAMVLSKEAIRLGMPSLTGALFRTIAALFVVWSVNIYTHHFIKSFVDLRSNPKMIWFLIGGCFFGTVGGLWLSLIALSNTQTGIATILMSLQVVFLPFLTWIIEHKRPAFGTLVGACIAFLGAVIVILR